VYDIGEHDGSPFIVAELLEGEELRQRLDEGAIPLRKVTEYALQIVSGLSAAHEKGIVHRDLKPENLFITNDDRVKILDFGLAKLREPKPDASSSEDATRRAITSPGVVMGTVGYMSPEQVRGHATDYRSDIFSFGLILYEMITGHRAFQHETMAETMSAILKEEPEEITESNPNISPSLERIVRRCLEKKPDRRFQSTSDLGFALESLSATTSSSGTGMHQIEAEPEPTKQIRRPLLYALGLLLLAAGAIAGILGVGYFRRSTMPSYEQLSFRRGFITHARFAPDGQTMIYSASWNGNPSEIFTTRSGVNESRPLGLKDADILAVSSTGELGVLIKRQYVYQMSYKGTLARVPMLGGTPREIAEDVAEADWSPDGKDLTVVRFVDGNCRLEYPVGKVLYETTTGYISYPRFSPKGDRIAFMDHELAGDNRGRIAFVDLAGKKTVISEGLSGEEGLAWSPSGDEVWYTGDNGVGDFAIYGATLSGTNRTVLRVPTSVWLHDTGRDGRVLLTTFKQPTDVVSSAAGETAERDLSWLDYGGIDDLSADGKTFLFEHWGKGSGINYSIYLGKTDGSPPVRLGEGANGRLSPDGKWVAAVRLEPLGLTLLPAGAGEIRQVGIPNIEEYLSVEWMPDSKRILFTGRIGKSVRLYVQSIDGGDALPIMAEGISAHFVTPDGKSILVFDPTGEKVTLNAIDGSGAPKLIPGLDKKDRVLRWGDDGHSLYVSTNGDFPVKVS
ncbi:MAG: protein kinase, partial [Acidobacteriota bacterium]